MSIETLKEYNSRGLIIKRISLIDNKLAKKKIYSYSGNKNNIMIDYVSRQFFNAFCNCNMLTYKDIIHIDKNKLCFKSTYTGMIFIKQVID